MLICIIFIIWFLLCCFLSEDTLTLLLCGTAFVLVLPILIMLLPFYVIMIGILEIKNPKRSTSFL